MGDGWEVHYGIMTRGSRPRREASHLITCNLTKPESTFDQVRKAYKDLKPTDVALVATALVEAGRYALAEYDGIEYSYPEQHGELVKAYCKEIEQIQAQLEGAPATTKRAAKTVEEEPITLAVKLKANRAAGEKLLGENEALKTLLSDLIEEGVEFLFSSTDIGWQWSLERVNWATASGGGLGRRYHFRAEFEGSIGVELGPGGKRKTTRGAKR